MGRLSRFEDHRYIGTRDNMVVHDCDDAEARRALEKRISEEKLLTRSLLQTFGPDSLAEARNRGFHPA